MLGGDRVEDQTVGARAITDGADVRKVGFLRVAQVRDETASGLNRRGPALQAEALEPVRLQLIEQRAPRRFGVEGPSVDVGHRQLQTRQLGEPLTWIRVAGYHDFARAQHSDL